MGRGFVCDGHGAFDSGVPAIVNLPGLACAEPSATLRGVFHALVRISPFVAIGIMGRTRGKFLAHILLAQLGVGILCRLLDLMGRRSDV